MIGMNSSLRLKAREEMIGRCRSIVFIVLASEVFAPPAFADVKRGPLRLLLSGEKSSAGRPMPDIEPDANPARRVMRGGAAAGRPGCDRCD